MQATGMLLIWIGAFCVLGGVLFMASQSIRRGRLSDAGRSRSAVGADTLEPKGRTGAFSLKANWPGLALMIVGGILLLVGGSL
jgi:hypothetical protein